MPVRNEETKLPEECHCSDSFDPGCHCPVADRRRANLRKHRQEACSGEKRIVTTGEGNAEKDERP